jgi:hypothetical protein
MINQELLNNLFEYCDGKLFRKADGWSRWKKGTQVGSIGNEGYLSIEIFGKNYKAHRLIFLMHYGWLPDEVDHQDGNRLNNKIDNLRPATKNQNQHNRKISKNNTSGVKGVSYRSCTNKWRVRVMLNNKSISIGDFKDLELAELVATMAREKYHGTYARH